MYDSLREQVTESHWPEEEREQWYRERPADGEYYRIQRELLQDGLTRKAKLTQLPPRGGPAHALGDRHRPSPLRLPEAEQYPLHVSLAFDDGGAGVGRGAGDDPAVLQVHQRRRRGAVAEVGPRGQLGERAAGPRKQLLRPPTPAQCKDGGAQKQRLPREAQLWPGARLYPGGRAAYPGPAQPEGQHLHPATAFETADEGYSGTPFPRLSENSPSFLPDSDDGGMDPGQALRNDGLNPPRPPTLGGASAKVAFRLLKRPSQVRLPVRRRRRGVCRRTRRCWPCEAAATGWTGPFAFRGGHGGWRRRRTKHRTALGSGIPAAEGGAAGGGGGAPGGGRHRELASQQLAEAEASEAFATAAEAAAEQPAGAAEAAARRLKAEGCWQHWARPWRR